MKTLQQLENFLRKRRLSARILVGEVRFYRGKSTVAQGNGKSVVEALRDAVKDYQHIHSTR